MSAVTYNEIKVFKHGLTDLTTLTRVVPSLVIGTFTQFLVVTDDNLWDRLYPDKKDEFNYTINFGVAIRDNNFESLDNIILPYFESCYSYQKSGKHNVVFDNKARYRFTRACDYFQGKHWDDIIDTLCDELLLLSKAGKVNGKYIYGDG